MILLLLACAIDDVTDRPTDDTANPTDTADSDTDTDADTDTDVQSIVGDWLSTGDDVSDLFAADPFNFVAITADFEAGGAYTVVVRDAEGQEGTLTGTYTASTDTLPGTITLQQATPSAATASGIWQVDGAELTYEVVQTVPDYGFVPPTPTSGFGTTSGPNIDPGVNVQVYVRQ